MLVIIDTGHGRNTLGKRTPRFPDGSVTLENEFNEVVGYMLQEKLEKAGFSTFYVAPELEDVSLSIRVDRANDVYRRHKKSKPNDPAIFVSIHFNAIASSWEASQASGVETYYYPGSTEGARLAKNVHDHLVQGTKQVDRGIKTARFYVLRKTLMPAILTESGFMDDMREASLMTDKAFQEENAGEIYRGIMDYFGIFGEDDKSNVIFDLENEIAALKETVDGLRRKLTRIEEIASDV